jgi:oxygen-independent coproporphyrinogen III oxidase
MPLSLYIHFPFCRNLCSYCDFYKEKLDSELETQYFRALETELALAKETIDPDNRILDTIYFGGGTPSLANLDLLRALLIKIRAIFIFDKNLEFSFEINPESIDSDRLLALKELGVNRPIFGVQSFDPSLLKILNRRHNLEDTFRAVYLARALRFENFGIDMIFGLPRQTGRKLSEDLAQLLELAPPHISYYQLTIEKGTPLDTMVADGKAKIPDSDLSAAMYRAINTDLSRHDYFRYEISSFALPGFECRHNMRYWEGGDFLGLGPSAHSFIGDYRFANSADLKTYLEKLARKERPLIIDTNRIEARITEAIMLGLRTARGINRQQFRHRFGISVEEAVNADNYNMMITSGLIAPDDEHIKLTDSGFPLADEIIRRLIK